MTIAERIKAARKSAGLTQKELGERMGVSDASVAQYESGQRNPKMDTLCRIAEALELPEYYFSAYEGFYPSNINDAQKMLHDSKLCNSAYDGLIAILGDIYGGAENRNIIGKYGSTTLVVFGKGDDAFVLDEEDIVALWESVKGAIHPIAERFKVKADYKLDEAVNGLVAFLNGPEARETYERASPDVQKMIAKQYLDSVGEDTDA